MKTRMAVRCAAAVFAAVAWIFPGTAEDKPPAPSGPAAQAEAKLKDLTLQVENAKKELIAARKAELEAKAKQPPPVTEMQIAVPRAVKPPVIDGKIGDEEWAMATVLEPGVGAANIGQRLKARQGALFYLAWDPENIYYAVRIPMREGEKPSRLNRQKKWDVMDVWETCAEFYIDTLGNGSHKLPARYQFIGTATGNQWDREDQYSIGQNMIDWNGEWQFKQDLSADGKFWEGEFAFPRKTVYAADPLKDGTRWKLGFAASMMFPWQWCGLYGWPVTAIFTDSAPSIRLTGIAKGLTEKKATGDLEIVNTTAAKLDMKAVLRLWSEKNKVQEILLEKELPVSLEPGAIFKHSFGEDASKAVDNQSYTYTVMVLSGDRSLFTFNRVLAYNDPENVVGLKVETSKEAFPQSIMFYPLSGKLSVSVDVWDMPQKDQVKSASISVLDPSGKAVAKGEVTAFDYGKGTAYITLPKDMAPGKYTAKAEVLDASGKVLASNEKTFERKDHAKEFPWLGNQIGMDDVVPRIFSPVEVKDDGAICGWRKEIRLDGSALPASIKAVDIELLKGPVQVRGRAAGQDFTMKPDGAAVRGKVSQTNANFAGGASGGGVRADVSWRFDYDSTARVEMKLSPAGDSPAKLDSLQLVIPFHGAAATHYMANGINMRQSNQAGLIPGQDKTGRVWDSTTMKAQKMTLGSFIPIVHVGNLSSGLTWFADNDKGWWPSDKAPAIEITRPDKDSVELVFNIASEPVELKEPRTIVFGLCVAPVRKMSYYRTTAHTIGFGHEKESGRWEPEKNPNRAYARVYPDNLEKFKKWVDDLHAGHILEKCYVENSPADFWEHEFQYFAAEWQSPFCRTAADNKLYWTDKFVKETNLDGYYFDNLFCRLYSDPEVTSAYVLPDGRIQPGYDLWDCREYLRRIRVVFEKYRNPTAIVFHNTDFQFAPCMGYGDLVMGGENPLPAMGTPDFMDMWKRDWMDVMYNQYLWGYALSHLFHFPADTFKDEMGEYDRAAAWKAFRTMQASMLVHGVEFWHGLEYRSNLMGRYRMFKSLPGEMQFIPSWQANGLFKVANNDPNLDVAVYKKDKALLVTVANYAKEGRRTDVWFDFPRLLPAPDKLEVRSIYDLETMEGPGYVVKEGGTPNFTISQPAHVNFNVGPRDFKAYLIVNEPVAQGAGF